MRRRSRGQALVEFALVFPIFLLLVIALVDVGRAVFAYNTVTNAAREGARLGIVNQDSTSIATRAIRQTQIAETAAPNVTVQIKKAIPNPDPATNANCAPIEVGCVVIVTYQTTYTPMTPIIGRILFGSGVTLTAKSIEAIEFVCPNTTIATASGCPEQP